MDLNRIPQHIAIIMDGNGRWARLRGLPKIAGHSAGGKTVDEITECAAKMGVRVLTLFTFSTENWKRPPEEIDALFKLLEDNIEKKEADLNKNNIKLLVIGKTEELPASTQGKLNKAIASTGKNTGMILNLALNYGGRSDIVNAARKLSDEVKRGSLAIQDITEEMFSKFLYTEGLPDPDLLIRTSGEFRLSNFLLWQVSYSEIYVSKKLWPDFKRKDFEKAVGEYQRRERRFGG